MVVGIGFLIRVPYLCVARSHMLLQLAAVMIRTDTLSETRFSHLVVENAFSCCSRCRPQVHEADSDSKFCFFTANTRKRPCLLWGWD